MDQLSERELAEEVNSERASSWEREWVRWGLSLVAAVYSASIGSVASFLGIERSGPQLASLLSRFLGYVKS